MSCSSKFQAVLKTLGYSGVVVLVDRVDESPSSSRATRGRCGPLVWPLLDHKFLRHPGISAKLLLPIELAYYLEKEDKEFYDRAPAPTNSTSSSPPLDRPSLYDLATDRLQACSIPTPPTTAPPTARGSGR